MNSEREQELTSNEIERRTNGFGKIIQRKSRMYLPIHPPNITGL